MNLDGWDMVSVVPMERVNAAMAASSDTPVDFSYRERPLLIEGRFGPWRIVPGGSVQLLHVDIPIAEGRYLDAQGRPPIVDLAGLVLRVELALRLIPAPDEPGAQDLVFDVARDGLDTALPPVRPLMLEGGEARMGAQASRVLMLALASCLSAHPDRISHVFARTRTSGPMDMAHHDWAWLETTKGGHLAMFGSIADPTPDMRPDHADPRLLNDGRSRAFALSDKTFFTRVLGPWMNDGFRPRGRFNIGAKGVSLATPLALPPRKEAGYLLRPVLHRLTFVRKGAGLRLSVYCMTRLDGHSITLHTEMTMTLPFAFDAKTGTVLLRPDPKPQSKTWAEGGGIWGQIEALIANFVLLFLQDSIAALASSIAKAMHRMNTGDVPPVAWRGQPAFKASTAALEDCFYFAEAPA
jgi:hypothetical protein